MFKRRTILLDGCDENFLVNIWNKNKHAMWSLGLYKASSDVTVAAIPELKARLSRCPL